MKYDGTTDEQIRLRNMPLDDLINDKLQNIMSATDTLVTKRAINRRLAEELHLKEIYAIREKADKEERKLSSLTLWRMDEEHLCTSWYSEADKILLFDPLQISLHPEVLKSLKEGKEYHITLHITRIDNEHNTVDIEDPYQRMTVETSCTVWPTNNLVFATIVKAENNSIRIISANETDIEYWSLYDSNDYKDFRKCSFSVDYEALPYAKKVDPLALAQNVGVANVMPAFYAYARQSLNPAGKPAKTVSPSDIFKTDLLNYLFPATGLITAKSQDENGKYVFTPSHDTIAKRRFLHNAPEDELPPYSSFKIFEFINADFGYLHMVHYENGKHYFTRELKARPEDDNSTELKMFRAPLTFSMKMAEEPFMS